MVAIRARFDGKRVVLPPRGRPRRACNVILIFEEDADQEVEREFWREVAGHTFAKAWDDDADSIYDTL